MWLFMLPEVLPKQSACNCNLYNMQSLLQVDEEIDVEERHPQLRNSDNRAGASSSQKDSLTSELASSEQRQGPPKLDLYREASKYKAPWMWSGYSPSPAATMEQSYSDGAQESEANRGRGSSSRQLSRLDRDMPLFTGPVSSWQGKQKHRSSHGQQQPRHRFEYDHEYEYPTRHRGDLNPAHPSCQQQHGPGTFEDDSEMGHPGFTPGPQSSGWVSGERRLSSTEQQQEENGSKMPPPGFPVAPQSNGWGPRPSSNAAASELQDNGTRPPGFPAASTSSTAARRMQQQRQNGQRGQPTR